MANQSESGFDAIFVGGGVIGLSCAWRAARDGARVCVLERDVPAAGATGVAAGMLAPVGETAWGEEEVLSLNLESLRLWPEFASRLEADAGDGVGFEATGALHVALDRDESEELRRRHRLCGALGLDAESLTGSACRELEPGLATAVRGGLLAPGEATVDPRRLVAALLAACERAGVEVHSDSEVVAASRQAGGWIVETAKGATFEGATLVLTAGCWSGQAQWLPPGARPPVRPVKGEILTLSGSASEPVCGRIVAGERVYLVPRDDGRLIVGATVEERGFDTTLTAGGVHELLREAYRLIPEIAELELAEASVGLRPGTPDNAPLIGPGGVEGLVIATGHFRNGVLQAPLTAECVAALIAGETPPFELGPFSPLRFAARETRPAMGVA